MKEITQDVYLIEGLRAANVYLLASDDGLALGDTGMAGDVDWIVAQIVEAGYDPSALQSIIVTHAHPDHIGGLPKLVRRFDAQVIAHQAEVPYLEGTERMPAESWMQRVTAWLGALFLGGAPQIEVAKGLEDGEVLDLLGGLRVIHTPGHTPGSMCLYQEARHILFCGDLLFNGHPFTGRGGLQYPPRLFSVDPAEVQRSARRLLDLEIDLLCPGHGDPITREAEAKIAALVGG
ncbi:MAG: MBL fold metallo-hydrolase [Chloroflexi bacterium]|jgi:glyoxylase-like metal-dependent hydrolase (beta-lactamase superfamily II)|nr:MBL fold metallo-hydrolase [Chloroflexota bacterium]